MGRNRLIRPSLKPSAHNTQPRKFSEARLYAASTTSIHDRSFIRLQDVQEISECRAGLSAVDCSGSRPQRTGTWNSLGATVRAKVTRSRKRPLETKTNALAKCTREVKRAARRKWTGRSTGRRIRHEQRQMVRSSAYLAG